MNITQIRNKNRQSAGKVAIRWIDRITETEYSQEKSLLVDRLLLIAEGGDR